MSRYRRRASASMPSKLIFKLPHSRSARETAVPACRAAASVPAAAPSPPSMTPQPFKWLPSMESRRSATCLRSSSTKVSFLSRFIRLSSRAAAMPTMPGTFSVPARLPFSCAPPSNRLSVRNPFFTYKNPQPFGPWNLCAETDRKSACSFVRSISTCPAACTASV